MNEIQQKINQLSDTDIVLLTRWVFNRKKREIDSSFSDKTIKELKSENIISDFNSLLNNLKISSLIKRPKDQIIVETYRTLLIDFAEKYPDLVKDAMKGLGMQADLSNLAQLLSGVDLSEIILMIILLGSFRISYECNQTENKKNDPKRLKQKQLKIEIGLPIETVKEMLKTLPLFKNRE